MAKAKGRVKYEVDPHNRLIISKTGKKSEIAKYRYLVNGKFKIDKKNNLIYHIKKAQDYDVPQQVKFSGNWSLSKDHNLVLTLNKWGNQIADNKLTIKGKIEDVRGRSLLFTVMTKTPDSHTHLYMLRLSGSWKVDNYNRLSFNVEKERRPFDALTLGGVWEINRQNKLIYRYTKVELKTKQKKTGVLILKGHWGITDRFKLSYALSGVQRPSITISGRWRMDRKRGLLFEVKYEKGKIRAIVFGADVKLSKRNNFEIRLKNKTGKDLGIKLVLSRKMLKGTGQAFLKALGSKRELAIHAGAGFIW